MEINRHELILQLISGDEDIIHIWLVLVVLPVPKSTRQGIINIYYTI